MNMLVSDPAPGARGPWSPVEDTVRMPWSPEGALPDTVVRPALAVLFRMAVGPAADYYVPRLLRREGNARTAPGWVWPAFFAPAGWAFYRKLWLTGTGFAALHFLGFAAFLALEPVLGGGDLAWWLALALLVLVLPGTIAAVLAVPLLHLAVRASVRRAESLGDRPDRVAALLAGRNPTSLANALLLGFATVAMWLSVALPQLEARHADRLVRARVAESLAAVVPLQMAIDDSRRREAALPVPGQDAGARARGAGGRLARIGVGRARQRTSSADVCRGTGAARREVAAARPRDRRRAGTALGLRTDRHSAAAPAARMPAALTPALAQVRAPRADTLSIGPARAGASPAVHRGASGVRVCALLAFTDRPLAAAVRQGGRDQGHVRQTGLRRLRQQRVPAADACVRRRRGSPQVTRSALPTPPRRVARAARRGNRAAAPAVPALPDSEVLLSALGVSLVVTRGRRFVWANAAVARLLGYSVADFVELAPETLFSTPRAFRSEAIAARAALETGGIHSFERPLRRRDGETRWVRVTGRRLDMDDGAAGTLWSLEDTQEAHQLAAACREADMRWQFAIGIAGEGIWDWNLETGQVFLSRPLQEMLGYTDGELAGDVDAWHERVHPDDRERVAAAQRPLLEGRADHYEVEHRLRGKDGAYRWIVDRCTVAARRADGAPARLIGVHLDIHERKLAERTLLERDLRLSKLSSEVPGLIFQFRVDANGWMSLPFASEGIRHIFGVAPDEVRERRPPGVLPPSCGRLPGRRRGAPGLGAYADAAALRGAGGPARWHRGLAPGRGHARARCPTAAPCGTATSPTSTRSSRRRRRCATARTASAPSTNRPASGSASSTTPGASSTATPRCGGWSTIPSTSCAASGRSTSRTRTTGRRSRRRSARSLPAPRASTRASCASCARTAAAPGSTSRCR